MSGPGYFQLFTVLTYLYLFPGLLPDQSPKQTVIVDQVLIQDWPKALRKQLFVRALKIPVSVQVCSRRGDLVSPPQLNALGHVSGSSEPCGGWI